MEDAWVDDIMDDARAKYDAYLDKEVRKRKKH